MSNLGFADLQAELGLQSRPARYHFVPNLDNLVHHLRRDGPCLGFQGQMSLLLAARPGAQNAFASGNADIHSEMNW
jgi:hypothetical protein